MPFPFFSLVNGPTPQNPWLETQGKEGPLMGNLSPGKAFQPPRNKNFKGNGKLSLFRAFTKLPKGRKEGNFKKEFAKKEVNPNNLQFWET